MIRASILFLSVMAVHAADLPDLPDHLNSIRDNEIAQILLHKSIDLWPQDKLKALPELAQSEDPYLQRQALMMMERVKVEGGWEVAERILRDDNETQPKMLAIAAMAKQDPDRAVTEYRRILQETDSNDLKNTVCWSLAEIDNEAAIALQWDILERRIETPLPDSIVAKGLAARDDKAINNKLINRYLDDEGKPKGEDQWAAYAGIGAVTETIKPELLGEAEKRKLALYAIGAMGKNGYNADFGRR